MENYIFYYSWFWIIVGVLAALIPGPGSQSQQTHRVLSLLLGLPVFGHLLGWW